MKSRVPPGDIDIDSYGEGSPTRPADVSLGQWLSARMATPEEMRSQPAVAHQPMAPRDRDDIAAIHRQLDGITEQIERLSQRRQSQARHSQTYAHEAAEAARPAAGPTVADTPGLADRLNDAISRLDKRLANMARPPAADVAAARRTEAVDRAAAQLYHKDGYQPVLPPGRTGGIDSAIAEISARHRELNSGAPAESRPAAQPRRSAPEPLTPPSPNLTSLEKQLHLITAQIETLRRPDDIDRSIESFRSELAEIRRTLTEAMPRQAIESLESEIRSVARRIDQGRQNGIDSTALAGVERALGDIYGVLRTLMPAEQLAGFDTAIRNLSAKIDVIVGNNPDPSAIEQLEAAISALRNIGSNVASNEALGQLGNDVRVLGDKVEQLAQTADSGRSLAALEQRIAALTAALETRPQPVLDTSTLEGAIHALADRIDRLQTQTAQAGDTTADGAAALAQVERRISYLLDRLENIEAPAHNLGRVEDGLADVLRHLENQRASFAELAELRAAPPLQPAPAFDTAIFETIKHELTDFRLSQNESDRRTQDTLETVHNTLGHVLDRLTSIEDDLKRVQALPATIVEALPAQERALQGATRSTTTFSESVAPVENLNPIPSVLAREPEPVDTIFEPLRPELPNPVVPAVARTPSRQPPATPRAPIDATLPPDHPLEPGSRQPVRSSLGEPEAATADAAPEMETGSPPNFIAAARRAAQAAAAATKEKPSRVTVLGEAARSAIKLGSSKVATAKATGKAADAAAPATTSSRIRSLLVGASVIVIVLSGFKMTMDFFGGSDNSASAPVASKIETPAPATPPAMNEPKTDAPAPIAPTQTPPAAPERQSLITPAPTPMPAAPEAASAAPAPADVTGSLAAPTSRSLSAAPAPAMLATLPPGTASQTTDAIPDQIAGPALRAAAQRGEPTAAHEIAVRYAEGRGAPSNYAEATRWYERAAEGGIVPAMFRLGTILEKGLGGKKDLDAARRYYMQAAERGHAKAMHNLAVLDADGGGKGPNYKAASGWFKKAAEHGVTDSQYNLAILYARGIGVEQNLAESFKWFSLAAAQGDADAGRKRDDVAKRLDPQSLAAAKLAIQTFVPESQPSEALVVPAPPGGWDTAAAPASTPAVKRGGAPQKSAPKNAIKPAKPTPSRSASAQ